MADDLESGKKIEKSHVTTFTRNRKMKKIRRMWMLYVFLIIPIGLAILFNYVPLYGIQLAFKDFRAVDGIWGSQWNNFKHFKTLFSGFSFPKALINTIKISSLRILIGFPAPILFAILLNELRHIRYKKVVQTISYLPHFMSWVVLSGLIKEVLSPTRGVINYLIGLFGIAPIYFLTVESAFVPVLITTSIWQSVGWGAVIYLASISSIDPSLYEAAEVDGANRFQKASYITIPMLIPVMVILFILGLGDILNGGFDQIFNLMNPKVMNVADIIDTYTYRIGIEQLKYDLSTAVSLFKNVVGVVLIIMVNFFARRYTEYGIW